MKSKMDTYKTIKIPHLRFSVHFFDMSKLQGVEKKGSGYTCILEDGSATVFIEDIEKSIKKMECVPIITHEIIHVIQIICEKYNMKIENEVEHMAYIVHYLLEELLTPNLNK